MHKTGILLTLSIILNIFLVAGIAGGAFWLNREHRMIFAGALRVAGSELPQETRKAFRAVLREARKSENNMLIAASEARLEAARQLREPVLNQAAVLDALTRARAADATVRTAVEQSAVTFAATLTPEERSKLADAIEQRSRRRLDNAD
ncbi:periplasmic heavy metal sensor [Rhizobium sp. 9140]|uniref:periplasmic heavy metal sensor n=1 Tax=Rhizobium sp. 9140 TaxID=1761900 RepID=UPI00079C7574|nr:periplasmic heavy metal sensor [Rhizobium sp. 9140]CZT37256.1 Uncharacterized membrane protein [Rhizobium sp. 9140]